MATENLKLVEQVQPGHIKMFILTKLQLEAQLAKINTALSEVSAEAIQTATQQLVAEGKVQVVQTP